MKKKSALRENSEKWPIGGDLSVLPFLGIAYVKIQALGGRSEAARF